MQTVTHHGAPDAPAAAKKPFSWTYSKLKNFDACGLKHQQVDILKKHTDGGEGMEYGNLVHDILAKYIRNDTPIPEAYRPALQYYGDMGKRINGEKLVEQQLAIDENLKPVSWFAKNAWHRSIADVIGINGPVAIALDWKTGKILEDGVQLSLIAACIFAHHPQVMAVRTEFVWLKHKASSRVNVLRSDLPKLWAGVLPRVNTYKHAYETDTFLPRPGGLCRNFCPVSSCKYHGIGG